MRTESEKLAYLAGILDGEGCITLHLQKKSGRHLCRVNICNTDVGIIEACRKILFDINVYFVEWVTQPTGLSRKPLSHIEICRQFEAKCLLEKLLPYLQSYKKQKAIDLIKYVNSAQFDKLGRRLNRRKKV